MTKSIRDLVAARVTEYTAAARGLEKEATAAMAAASDLQYATEGAGQLFRRAANARVLREVVVYLKLVVEGKQSLAEVRHTLADRYDLAVCVGLWARTSCPAEHLAKLELARYWNKALSPSNGWLTKVLDEIESGSPCRSPD